MTLPKADELVFMPNVGFRLASGAMADANVVVEREGRTLTAALSSDRDGAEIRMTIAGVSEELDFRQSRPAEAPVRVTDDHGRLLEERPSRYHLPSHFCRLMEGPTFFQRMVSLDRIPPDVLAVDVVMSGAAGEWRMQIPVEPRSATGPRGVPTNAIDIRHGIAVAAPLVARTEAMTAVELETYFVGEPDSEPKRSIAGLSSLNFHRGFANDLLMLRDSTGAHHLERPRAVWDVRGTRRRREVALFEPMVPDAVSASLEIPYVTVHEMTGETVYVPVLGDTEVTLAGCHARVRTSRVDRSSDSTADHPSPVTGLNGPCVRIVLVPEDPDAERSLVSCGVLESNDRGMTMSIDRASPPVIEVPDPTGDSPHITLHVPLIRLRGPWKLEIPLPRP